jgi:putative ABC transport system permease protein
MLQDLRYALRQLRGAPIFTLTAVLTLALSIGATVTMYSIVRSVLLEPLPFPQQDRLVGLALTFPQEKPNNNQAGVGADFVMQHSRSFESFGVVGESPSGSNLSIGSGADGHALQITVEPVSKGYFPTLGVQPMLGRNFTTEEDLPNGPRVMLLSYGLWTRLFNRDASVLDRVVHINGESFTVVGVMPASMYDEYEGPATDLWQPLQLSRKDPGYEGDNYNMIARLRSGVSIAQAQQEMDSLKDPFYKEFPTYLKWMNSNKLVHEFRVWQLKDVMASDSRSSLLALAAAVIAVLLVACLNLAGLMTARSSRRMKEIALRTALGASHGSVLRLLLCESLLLAIAGAGLGVLLAQAAIPALIAVSPVHLPEMHSALNGWLLAGFSLPVAYGTTMIFGLIPALAVFRQNEGNALQSGHSIGATASQMRLGRALIVGQVAVASVLLVSASLLLGSFLKLRSIPSGVQTKRLEIAQVTLKGDTYTITHHTTQFIDAVMTKLKSYPGVDHIAAVNGLPLDRGMNINGRPAEKPNMEETIQFRAVTPGYFRTLGMPLLSGRDLTVDDNATAAPVVVISETAARQWWPGKSAIGEQVVLGDKLGGQHTVVGVVADTHNQSLIEAPRMVIYEPFAQIPDGFMKMLNGWFATTFAMRLSGNVDVTEAVQRAVSGADSSIPIAKMESMQTVVDSTLAGPQFFSWLAGGFAGFALLLTMIGLFGLLSYQVTQRTREIGVRLAIGADRQQILMLILRRGLMLTGIGLVIGTVVSLGVPRLVRSVLADNLMIGDQGIAGFLSSSSVSLLVAALAMIAAAAFASYLPALRAARIEPMEALRIE